MKFCDHWRPTSTVISIYKKSQMLQIQQLHICTFSFCIMFCLMFGPLLQEIMNRVLLDFTHYRPPIRIEFRLGICIVNIRTHHTSAHGGFSDLIAKVLD
jgi:hypothetical protein